MEITFRTRKLQKVLNSLKDINKNYGDRMALAIQSRLAVLRNANNLFLVPSSPPVRLHQLSGDRQGQFAVDLVHPQRLIFVPNHDPVALREEGGIDRDKVTAITIIEVTDYH